MKITSATFLGSAVGGDQFPPEDLPELAFAGRSNVGKSSLINYLLNRRSLARTSSTPGKTQTINFYEINGAFRFVDLPGYGYAKVSKAEKAKWGSFIELYLRERKKLVEIILLLDVRRKVGEDDIQMLNFIRAMGYQGRVVLTKIDKLNQSQIVRARRDIEDKLGVPKEHIFIISNLKAKGKYPLWESFNKLFQEKGFPINLERQISPEQKNA
ncbi:MAG: YihA family ribosome biogenesis GTP-binding protein [Tissierellia bacterium]|nr:YihA family ribosome biogenesis GTP-binding protein [Tissierellia bacterium]